MIDLPQSGLFVGRVWRAGIGPALVTLRNGHVFDITTRAAPTMRDLLEQPGLARALESLAAAGKLQWYGRGRGRRWLTPPMPGFATALLLPAPLPGD